MGVGVLFFSSSGDNKKQSYQEVLFQPISKFWKPGNEMTNRALWKFEVMDKNSSVTRGGRSWLISVFSTLTEKWNRDSPMVEVEDGSALLYLECRHPFEFRAQFSMRRKGGGEIY